MTGREGSVGTATDDISKPGSLHDLQVLITRPEAQAHKWQTLLEQNGAATQRVPLMAIVPFEDGSQAQAIKDRVMSLADYQHVIFVSQNAVSYGLHWIDQYWPQLPVRVCFYAVGAATAKGLRDYGCPVVEAGHTMDTEALLVLPSLQDVEHEKVLIFRGQGGRPKLAEVLEQRGASVDFCELYQRRLPLQQALTALRSQSDSEHNDKVATVVSLHSGETLHNWLQVLQQLQTSDREYANRLTNYPVLVPGERVATIAREHLPGPVIVAQNASDTMMLNALTKWHEEIA